MAIVQAVKAVNVLCGNFRYPVLRPQERMLHVHGAFYCRGSCRKAQLKMAARRPKHERTGRRSQYRPVV
ncbi:MAG: hypothetical protein AAB699_03475 [Patescibacteria group bacterium]